MNAPAEIVELIKRFDSHRESYKSGQYNETQVRREFIDPLFTYLGWDVDNKQGYAESYKDVIHEDAIKVGGVTKAPDYCFRVGGTRKFFLEAKKPSVNLKDDASPAFQLRRYAWSAKLSLSILTDFDEFVVYDCRIKPVKTDKASTARIFYLTYNEFVRRWDEIASVFSREAVLKGSFDKYAESKALKKGTAEVDNAFLKEIEFWRETLAGNLALRNPQLTQRELNFAVQRTIDRLIFLRICEDRGVEDYGRLMALKNGKQVYPRLCQIYHRADERYNSGLFHFRYEKGISEQPDKLTPNLNIDDAVLKEIIKNLYYPDSPYEFSVLPADILGQVYEQFLGKVIRLTPGHRAVIEDKPEVKKAGGVYYTPTYIVDYIVGQTVGKMLDGKTPRQVAGIQNKGAPLRILDPACGSGSFLIGAYQYLLDWHRDWYIKNSPEKWMKGKNPQLCHGPSGDLRLTTAERKRILLTHIYGVDIDPQAVEVTKLSLLLKVLEGENEQTINSQFLLFHERVLPNLCNNIKCGNSLIGSDFKQIEMGLFFEEINRINAFDWDKEFPNIFQTGGFDCIIGNPPYGYLFNDSENLYLSRKYNIFSSIPDAYAGFCQKAHDLLCEGGKFGFIIPSAWLGGPTYKTLRNHFLKFSIETIILLPFDIFKDAYIDTVLITTCKQIPTNHHTATVYEYPKREKIFSINLSMLPVSKIEQKLWEQAEDCKFILNKGMINILSKLRITCPDSFNKSIIIKRGVLFDKKLLSDTKMSDFSYKYFEGNIYRYITDYSAPRWVEYGPKMKEYPREFCWFEGRRILLRRLVNRKQRLMASIIECTTITNKNLYVIKLKEQESLEYLLGIINSYLISKLYLAQVSQAAKDDFPQVTIKDILSLPLPTINFSNTADKACHDRIVDLVKQMLSLHQQLAATTLDHDKNALQRQIDVTDRQIDRLVYELYDLTDEEIKIVEKG